MSFDGHVWFEHIINKSPFSYFVMDTHRHIYIADELCLPVYDMGLDVCVRQLNVSNSAIARELWVTGLSACSLILNLPPLHPHNA